jgi:hypothetical protein
MKGEELLERGLRWIIEVTLKDRKRNEDIRCTDGVASIGAKLREARLVLYGHVQRREDTECIKRISVVEEFGHRSRERQKNRWRDLMLEDMRELRLTHEGTEDRTD